MSLSKRKCLYLNNCLHSLSMLFHCYVNTLGPYPVHLSFKEVTVCAGHEVLMEADNNSAMIVGKPQVILGQQLRSHSINILNSILILSNVKLCIIKSLSDNNT
jgi:hypothetical protein